MVSNPNTALAQANPSALSVAQLDHLIEQKEREISDAAQNAAPLSWQLQLGRELAALREYRVIGQSAMMEVADLTLSALQTGATIGLLGQVMIDGLRGKVDDSVIECIDRIRGTGLEATELIQASTAASLLDRTQAFKARSSDVRFRDLGYAIAFNKMPGKLGPGRQ